MLDKEGNPYEKKLMPLGIVIDERVCSGCDYAHGFAYMERLLKNPAELEKIPGEE